METEPHRSQINTLLKKMCTRTHTRLDTFRAVRVRERARRHAHTLNTSRASHEREKRRTGETAGQTDKDRYLFVHLDVEAVRHLVVLRRGEEGGRTGSDG